MNIVIIMVTDTEKRIEFAEKSVDYACEFSDRVYCYLESLYLKGENMEFCNSIFALLHAFIEKDDLETAKKIVNGMRRRRRRRR